MEQRTSAGVIGLLVAAATMANAQAMPAPSPAKPDTAIHAAPAAPAVDTAMSLAIRHLLVTMGTKKNLELMVQSMMDLYRQQLPTVPERFWTEFQQEMKADEVIEMVIPIYAQHFTLEDIHAMEAFYSTPTGQKFIAEQPAIMKESMTVGARWGAAIGERIMREVKARGFVKS